MIRMIYAFRSKYSYVLFGCRESFIVQASGGIAAIAEILPANALYAKLMNFKMAMHKFRNEIFIGRKS